MEARRSHPLHEVAGSESSSGGKSTAGVLVRRGVEPAPDAAPEPMPASGVALPRSKKPKITERPAAVDSKVGNHADYIYHRLLAGADSVSIIAAASIAALVAASSARVIGVETMILTAAVMVPVWFIIAYGAGLYHEVERRIDHNFVDEIGTIVIASTAWAWLFVLTRSLLSDGSTALLPPALMWLLMIPLILASRSLVRRHAKRRPWHQRSIAIFGDPAGVSALTERIGRHPEWGLNVSLEVEIGDVGEVIVRGREGENETKLGSARAQAIVAERILDGSRIGNEREMANLVMRAGIDRAVVAGGSQDLNSRTRLVHELIEREIAVDQISGGPETLYSKAFFQDLEGLPMLSVRPASPRPVARGLKRLVDIVVSGCGLILAFPIFLWAAIRIKLDSKGPVFYRQPRCGLNDSAFELIKFRTMVDGAHEMRSALREETKDQGNDDVLFKIKEDPRITKFGEKLRRLSVDELPQLWNVFKGDMSMVGPRPLVFEEALQATDLFAARTRMKPGIAGPWQALGRSTIPFEDMLKLDYAYVMSWSMSEDMRLLLRTITAVTKGSGAH